MNKFWLKSKTASVSWNLVLLHANSFNMKKIASMFYWDPQSDPKPQYQQSILFLNPKLMAPIQNLANKCHKMHYHN